MRGDHRLMRGGHLLKTRTVEGRSAQIGQCSANHIDLIVVRREGERNHFDNRAARRQKCRRWCGKYRGSRTASPAAISSRSRAIESSDGDGQHAGCWSSSFWPQPIPGQMHGARLPNLARVIVRRVAEGGAPEGQSELCNRDARLTAAAPMADGIPVHDMRGVAGLLFRNADHVRPLRSRV